MGPMLYRRRNAARAVGAGLLAALALALALSGSLRQKAAAGLRRALTARELFAAALFLETGYTLKPAEQAAPPPAVPEPAAPAETETASAPETEPLPETEAPTAPPAEPQSAPFTAADAEGISMRGNCTYRMDKLELLTRPLGWERAAQGKVLIIHSHSCESYTQCEGHTYLPDANFRTLQKEESVIAVGDALARELEALGVKTLHERGYNDYPDYNRSYAEAREKIAGWLEKEPDIVMVLDLHRDALEKPVRETAALGGVTCARLMLVVGTDEGGLHHPDWERNLSCALKLQALANREEPELFKALSFRKERFNMDMTPGSLIVEVGSTENTLPEAEASMPYLARYVAQLLELARAEETGGQ